jgi:RNA polymerase sigma-70 factor, ECF subfamily
MENHGQTRQAIAALLPRLRRFAMTLTGALDVADDLVQAAVERALNRLHQWQPGTRLDSWLFRIMQTVWLNEMRARRIRSHEQLDSAREVIGDPGEKTVETKMMLRKVEQEFRRLTLDQQQAMVLVCVEGYTHREAADILDIPIGTVISRLARGRMALIDRIEPAAGARAAKIVPLRRGS